MRKFRLYNVRAILLCSLFCATLNAAISVSPEAADSQKRVVIIKADDLRVPNEKWKRFVRIIEEKDIKASIGLIAYGFPGYDSNAVQWTREQESSGRIEFWNHGWDHNIWKDDDGRKVSEFSRSGYEHQKANLEKSQRKMVKILGHSAQTFGAPFNAMDEDTIRVLEEMLELQGIFYYHKKEPLKSTTMDSKSMLYMNLPGENDGVGKPNFQKFKKKYASKQEDVSFTALQFHPPYFSEEGFGEFEKIVDFLKAEGWVFMLPGEYLESLAQ